VSDAETTVATEQAPLAEGGVIEAQAVVTEEAVGIQPLVIGPAPTTDWRSWVAQQGGIQPTSTNAPPFPPATSGGTAGTAFPGVNPILTTVAGAQSTPVYSATPVTVKPADPQGGWTALMGGGVQIPSVFPPPIVQITSVTPNLGVPAGGTAVTVRGFGFTGATAVNFGATPGTALVVVNDSTITITSPLGTTKTTVAVSVVTPAGTATLYGGFNYS
jgi:hypothetical protein